MLRGEHPASLTHEKKILRMTERWRCNAQRRLCVVVCGQSDAEEQLLSCESADTKRQAFCLLIDPSSQDRLTSLSPTLVSIVRGDLVCLQISMQAKTANRVLLAICLVLTCVGLCRSAFPSRQRKQVLSAFLPIMEICIGRINV